MNIEDLRQYCLSLPMVTEKMPWAHDRIFQGGLCFCIFEKWFCFTDVDNFEFINMKLPPHLNQELRARYEAVCPGWHMNKKYWSSVYHGRDMTDQQIYDLVKVAYQTVVASLPSKNRKMLEQKNNLTQEIM